ncbi:hypothetical protein DUI87_33387 [Hirundo rustica rustica]|uniref:Uncharacterized protein n=1 Tax=Hirundo rustica rustica TaxID=333673 RepID=A0A3M0ILJ0_HIRRU|nr:hypothetical protein DUI87_33387 [Hirundo rustica rustica]
MEGPGPAPRHALGFPCFSLLSFPAGISRSPQTPSPGAGEGREAASRGTGADPEEPERIPRNRSGSREDPEEPERIPRNRSGSREDPEEPERIPRNRSRSRGTGADPERIPRNRSDPEEPERIPRGSRGTGADPERIPRNRSGSREDPERIPRNRSGSRGTGADPERIPRNRSRSREDPEEPEQIPGRSRERRGWSRSGPGESLPRCHPPLLVAVATSGRCPDPQIPESRVGGAPSGRI